MDRFCVIVPHEGTGGSDSYRQRIEGGLPGAGERDWGLVFTGARASVWGDETFLDWAAVGRGV